MTIDDIYEAAKARALTGSLRHFSTALLGRPPNHAVDTGLGRCSADAPLNLHRRLGDLGRSDLQARVAERLLAAGARDGAVQAVRK